MRQGRGSKAGTGAGRSERGAGALGKAPLGLTSRAFEPSDTFQLSAGLSQPPHLEVRTLH